MKDRDTGSVGTVLRHQTVHVGKGSRVGRNFPIDYFESRVALGKPLEKFSRASAAGAAVTNKYFHPQHPTQLPREIVFDTMPGNDSVAGINQRSGRVAHAKVVRHPCKAFSIVVTC